MDFLSLHTPDECLAAAKVVAAVFAATLVRSTFGFGEALVAVPLLAFLIPVKVAVPLATLFSVAIAAFILAQDWRHVHVRSAGRLVVPTFFGIPIGLVILTNLPEAWVKAGLAAVIIGFSMYCLLTRRKLHLPNDRLAWLFGFGGGILGGAYGMNGPPLVVYGTLRGWTPEQFRATLQGYFLLASFVGLMGYTVEGLWAPAVTGYFLLSAPAAAVAILLGRAANRRMNPPAFVRYVHVGLIGIGLLLLSQAM